MARAKISDTQKAEIVALYESGGSTRELQTAYDIAPGTLYRILHLAGVMTQRTKKGIAVTHPTTALQVKVDAEQLVESAEPVALPRGHTSTWEVHYTGILSVQAESIDQALTEARKLSSVRRIYHVRLRQ